MRILAIALLVAACGPSSSSTGTGGGGGSGGSGGGTANCNSAAKTPANLVGNDGFECGDMGWSAQTGDLAVVTDARTGTKALKLTATSAGGKFASTQPFVASTSGKTYCAVAYLKGTVANAQLSVLESKSGAVVDHTFSTPVASTSWLRTPPSTNLEVRAAAGSKLYVRFVMHTPPAAGDTLLVDDVDVWESDDGKCKER